MDHVWYAAFGSNLSWARFEKYLSGGSPERSSGASDPGARDDSAPTDQMIITVDRELFFAHESPKWDGGGVAFLATAKSNTETICRAYKITVEQFEDVHQQENRASTVAKLDVDELLARGAVTQFDGLYGVALLLSVHDDGCPIVTITTGRTTLEPNGPSVGYAATIASGLVEGAGMTRASAVDYVLSKRGAVNSLDKAELLAALES